MFDQNTDSLRYLGQNSKFYWFPLVNEQIWLTFTSNVKWPDKKNLKNNKQKKYFVFSLNNKAGTSRYDLQ